MTYKQLLAELRPRIDGIRMRGVQKDLHKGFHKDTHTWQELLLMCGGEWGKAVFTITEKNSMVSRDWYLRVTSIFKTNQDGI